MKFMNKRGYEAGTGISFTVSLTLTVLIMVIFVAILFFLSFTGALDRDVFSSRFGKAELIDYGSILFEEIEIDGAKRLVIEAAFSLEDFEEKQKVKKGLGDLMSLRVITGSEKNCFGLSYDINEDALWSDDVFANPKVRGSYIVYVNAKDEAYGFTTLTPLYPSFVLVDHDRKRVVHLARDQTYFIEYFETKCDIEHLEFDGGKDE